MSGYGRPTLALPRHACARPDGTGIHVVGKGRRNSSEESRTDAPSQTRGGGGVVVFTPPGCAAGVATAWGVNLYQKTIPCQPPQAEQSEERRIGTEGVEKGRNRWL